MKSGSKYSYSTAPFGRAETNASNTVHYVYSYNYDSTGNPVRQERYGLIATDKQLIDTAPSNDWKRWGASNGGAGGCAW